MIIVYASGEKDFDSALLLFKKRIEKDGILRELKGRRYHLTPLQRRREKDNVAARRRKQREARRLRYEG